MPSLTGGIHIPHTLGNIGKRSIFISEGRCKHIGQRRLCQFLGCQQNHPVIYRNRSRPRNVFVIKTRDVVLSIIVPTLYPRNRIYNHKIVRPASAEIFPSTICAPHGYLLRKHGWRAPIRAELHAEKKEEGVQRELLLPAGEPDDPARAI